MKYYLLFAISLGGLQSFAQGPDLEVGIYNSFYNFVNNRPLPAHIRINRPKADPLYLDQPESEETEPHWRYISSDQVIFLPNIKVKRRAYLKRNMWGFYDGEYVYVTSKIYTRSNVTRYSRILHFGRYCYFYGAEDVYKKTAGVIGGLVGMLPVGHYYLLDMADGSAQKLTPEAVENIVKEFPSLHARFKKSRTLMKDMLSFIEEYNQLVEHTFAQEGQ